jgi:hypothetical protein|tara:strand:- start:2402 stop:3412 length:1011 start_codon:yes stop_codon:yes gene_type:complete
MEKPSLDTAKAGAMRFNTDSSQMEIYDGNQWTGILATSADLQTGGARGLFIGGRTPSNVDTIDYVTISTTGNAIDFGNRLEAGRQGGATASRIRGVICGRPVPLHSNIIEFLTIASTGNTQDFGDSTNTRAGAPMAVSNGTRGIFAGGTIDSSDTIGNIIDYVTIAQTGNAIDFGDLTHTMSDGGRAQSPTRGIIAGGRYNPTKINIINFITMSTLGNAADFGDLTQARNEIGSDSNAVRGIFAGGNNNGAVSTMDFVTISTLGNAVNFGSTSGVCTETRGSASSIRFVFSKGFTPSVTNEIMFTQIMSSGTAFDFGDLTQSRGQAAGCSNGHGGL